MRSFALCVCATVLLAAALVPRTAGAAEIPASPQQRWDANGLFAPADATASPSSNGAGTTTTTTTCPLKLRPSGQCGGSGARGEEGEDCPYQLTLPPLTIQLPKQFRLLEKTMKELQSLKETVNRLKVECRGGGAGGRGLEQYQADQGQVQVQVPIQGDSAEVTGPELGQAGTRPEERGDGTVTEGATGVTPGPGPGQGSGPTGTGSGGIQAYPFTMQEMQVKMNRMSISLRNARRNISTLQGRLENLNLVNIHNVQSIVDNRVENITEVVNNLKSSCNTYCPVLKARDLILAPRDCSDYNVLKERNGVYQVIPDRDGTFDVFCDMESFGGGWTVIQQRLNGSVSFNRTWADYKKGFGNLRGEFWLGNDHIHQLTKSKDMILRIELEDFEGVREYAKYDQFYVANEFLLYRLSVSGYSGTAGNAINFDRHFNHDQKFFTTPDRDNDRYPSGNCGAYYSSGWWFDACMSANLNGKYYHKRYKGVRNGIFWGTWHNQTTEYYPTNYRQAFKTVKMMIRPKNYAP